MLFLTKWGAIANFQLEVYHDLINPASDQCSGGTGPLGMWRSFKLLLCY